MLQVYAWVPGLQIRKPGSTVADFDTAAQVGVVEPKGRCALGHTRPL
jgi:hypothetical protein